MKKLIIATLVAGTLFATACGNADNTTENSADTITPAPGVNDPANSTYDHNTMDSTNRTIDSTMRDTTSNR